MNRHVQKHVFRKLIFVLSGTSLLNNYKHLQSSTENSVQKLKKELTNRCSVDTLVSINQQSNDDDDGHNHKNYDNNDSYH